MTRRGPFSILLLFFAVAGPAGAWNGTGHMTVAYIAHEQLDPAVKPKVLALLRENPDYETWVKGIPAGPQHDAQRLLIAFLRASEWPDDIRSRAGYVADGTANGNLPPAGAEAAQNVGYRDKLRHKYWHFHDQPFSPDRTSTRPAPTPSLLTAIPILIEGLRTSPSADVRSYDLVWLIHLVGDAHQPLHCTSRFTRSDTGGDDGGNGVKRTGRRGATSLHALWDGLLGDGDNLEQAIAQGKDLMDELGSPEGAGIADVSKWIDEGFELARTVAYAAPIRSDGKVSRTDQSYRRKARETAERQAVLGGHRLARLINGALK